MIEAQELRIGNWVEMKASLAPYFKIQHGEDIDDVIEHRLYEPILLTPELLEKCGFEKLYEDEYSWIGKDTIGYSITIRKMSGMMEFYFAGQYETSTEIRYVHQLQNLYFDLTGQELKVSL